LKNGADVNARGNFGKTALMYAVQFNLLDTAALLLERGADVNAKTTDTSDCWSGINISDRTALMYAAENADRTMVDLLLENGADAKAVDSRKYAADAYVDRNSKLSGDQDMDLYRRLRDAKGPQ
ncbi:MAG TPA: ankyrin repeat domain-containing protein, partial [Dongiaceae bacterium]|nr:ankyrin repeat domain-containing protein [Dongiaceae bacterium]